jgi:hypothetical protein
VSAIGQLAVHDHRGGQPVHDIVVQETHVLFEIGKLGVACRRRHLVRVGADKARQRIAHRFIPFRLAVIGIGDRAEVIDNTVQVTVGPRDALREIDIQPGGVFGRKGRGIILRELEPG